jgi:hypothetical protein
MESRVAILERTAEQTEAQRIDAIMRGESVAGAEVTTGSQIPRRELASAMVDLVESGLRPGLVQTFVETGHSDLNPKDRALEIELAEKWHKKLLSDPEMQKKLLAGDEEMKSQLLAYSIYSRRLGE